MTWFKVDDTLAFHSKVIAAGNAAMGLWVRAGAWSAQQLSDGWVPAHVAQTLGTPGEGRRLVSAGLWLPKDDGYQFHEWDERQPSRVEVMAQRSKRSDSGVFGNHRRWHARRGVVDPECPFCE